MPRNCNTIYNCAKCYPTCCGRGYCAECRAWEKAQGRICPGAEGQTIADKILADRRAKDKGAEARVNDAEVR